MVLANSRGPHALSGLIAELRPQARAAILAQADVVFLAFPYALSQVLPAEEPAGSIVLDNNKDMPWRDGHLSEADAGGVTIQELRQRQLPASLLSHIQFHGRVPMHVPGDALPRPPAAGPTAGRIGPSGAGGVQR